MLTGLYDLCSSFPDGACLCLYVYSPIFYLSYLFPFACVHFCAQPMCVPWTFLSQKRALDLLEL